MSVEKKIEHTLSDNFQLSHLEVINESHMHSGPNTESHFKVILVSDEFDGMRAKKAERLTSIHPVGRVHPSTQRKALFVNEEYTTHFEGMTREESRPLLEYLFQHSVRPEITCRVRWQRDTLVVWENHPGKPPRRATQIRNPRGYI